MIMFKNIGWEPTLFPDIIGSENSNLYSPMTAIASLKYTNGITVVADGLAIDTKPGSYAPIITDVQKDAIKVHRLTPYVVIGFSGKDLALRKLKGYTKEIKDKVSKKSHPLTLSDIADEAIKYLNGKLREGVQLDALIAGYEYDKDGKLCNPGYVRIIETDGVLNSEIDTDSFSAAGQVKGYLAIQSERGGIPSLAKPVQSNKEAADLLSGIIVAMATRLENGHFIGGEIRCWNISKGGINEQLLGKIPTGLRVGEELILPNIG